MAFVIDASVVLTWLFEDESFPAAEAIQDRLITERALVPTLWRHEVTNALVVACRRQRITQAQVDRFSALLERLPIEESDPAPMAEVSRLALAHRLSAYDGAYLHVAASQGLPLATVDARLAEAATALGVTLLVSRTARA
ncbi:MAG: type II toxin-antitoxin system VapC family toxin [Dermatophilaceae bacterium]